MTTSHFAGKRIAASFSAVILALGLAHAPANAEPTDREAHIISVGENFSAPDWYEEADVERELNTLSRMSEEEQDNAIRASLGLEKSEERIAPIVIVGAIACAVGVGGFIRNTNFDSAESVAWSVAGALLSCIPGAQQAKLASVILKNRAVIARALRAVGAVAAANMLAGDSHQP